MNVLAWFVVMLFVASVTGVIVSRKYEEDLKEERRLVKQLTDETVKQQKRILELEGDICKARDSVRHIIELDSMTPDDCKRGAWCTGCSFNKSYLVKFGWTMDTMYYCGKADACKNFVQTQYD